MGGGAISTSASFFWWTNLTQRMKGARVQNVALAVFNKYKETRVITKLHMIDQWRTMMRLDQAETKLSLALQKMGLKIMNKVKQRLLLLYAQECIKLWDKRHDAWIAQRDSEVASKAAGLRGIAGIIKKWDQQKVAALYTLMRRKMTDTKQVGQALMLIGKIMDGWDKRLKKAIIMNYKAKMRVEQGKQRNAAKREEAKKEMEKQSQIVKVEVTKIVASKKKEFAIKEKEWVQKLGKFESDVQRLQNENAQLRERGGRR